MDERCIKWTPRTEGYTVTEVLSAEGVVMRYQAGQLVNEGRYYFGHSGLDDTGPSIFIGRGEGVPIRFGVSADTLILDRSPVDGPQEIFVRRQEW